MAKKKIYRRSKDNDWDKEAAKEHRRIIAEKEKEITAKYKGWWDIDKKGWKDGFGGHDDSRGNV